MCAKMISYLPTTFSLISFHFISKTDSCLCIFFIFLLFGHFVFGFQPWCLHWSTFFNHSFEFIPASFWTQLTENNQHLLPPWRSCIVPSIVSADSPLVCLMFPVNHPAAAAPCGLERLFKILTNLHRLSTILLWKFEFKAYINMMNFNIDCFLWSLGIIYKIDHLFLLEIYTKLFYIK